MIYVRHPSIELNWLRMQSFCTCKMHMAGMQRARGPQLLPLLQLRAFATFLPPMQCDHPMKNPWTTNGKPMKETIKRRKTEIHWLHKHLRKCTIHLGHLRFQSWCWRGSGKLWRVFWQLLGFPGRGAQRSLSANLPKRITWQVLSGFNIQLSQAGLLLNLWQQICKSLPLLLHLCLAGNCLWT